MSSDAYAVSDVGKHRRNLLVVTCFLIFLKYADASITALALGGGAGLRLGNPDAILHFAWLIWVYEFVIFAQLSVYYMRPEYERARSALILNMAAARFLSLSSRHTERINDEYLSSLRADYRMYLLMPPKNSVAAPRDMRKAMRAALGTNGSSYLRRVSSVRIQPESVANQHRTAKPVRINLARRHRRRLRWSRTLRRGRDPRLIGWNLTAKRSVGIEEASNSEVMNYNFGYLEGTGMAMRLEWRLFIRGPFFLQYFFPKYLALAAPIYYLARYMS